MASDIVNKIVGWFRGPDRSKPGAGPALTSQRQANGSNFDGAAGTPYRVKRFGHLADPRPVPPPIVGRKQVKLPAARVFNATNQPRPYLIPTNRIAAQTASASNGSTYNSLTGAAYLEGRKIKEVITLDLSTVRTDFAINTAGSVVIYQDSTNGTDRIRLRFGTSDGDVSGPLLPVRPGQYVGGERFSTMFVTNAAIAGATATLVLAQDKPDDPFVVR